MKKFFILFVSQTGVATSSDYTGEEAETYEAAQTICERLAGEEPADGGSVLTSFYVLAPGQHECSIPGFCASSACRQCAQEEGAL